MVAIALTETGISLYDTIEYMRTHCRDIFNPYQLKFLHKYYDITKQVHFVILLINCFVCDTTLFIVIIDMIS